MSISYDFYNGFHCAIVNIELELMKAKDAETLKKVRAINKKLHEEIMQKKQLEEKNNEHNQTDRA